MQLAGDAYRVRSPLAKRPEMRAMRIHLHGVSAFAVSMPRHAKNKGQPNCVEDDGLPSFRFASEENSSPANNQFRFLMAYGRFDPQLPQKAPVFCAPHEHVHVSASGFFDPQLLQNLPVFSVPQEQVQLVFSGFLEPQPEQKLPVFTVPQEHFQPLAA